MSNLDDKILGEKLHYYCSSSSEDDSKESDGEQDNQKQACGPQTPQVIPQATPKIEPFKSSVFSRNTGPKSVIEDYMWFKQQAKQVEAEKERIRLADLKKQSLTCQTQHDEEKQKKEEQLDKEIQELLEDKILDEFIKKRMQETMASLDQLPKFGIVRKLKNGQEFLDAVDKDSPVTTIIHIYEEGNEECQHMNLCLEQLAKQYVNVQFCCLEATSAGMSRHFKKKGVPALLVYKCGNLIGNFVRLTDEFGVIFVAEEVENFLLEHGMLPDQSLVPTAIRQKDETKDESDSD